MHSERTNRWVEQLGQPGTLAIATLGALASGAIPWPGTPLVADLALATSGALALGLAGWTSQLRGQLNQLPLELADVIGSGLVDGQPIYRIRLRLGRGRRLSQLDAEVHWKEPNGQAHELPVFVPAGVLVGPVTLVARDPERRIESPGHLQVRALAHSGGQRWSTEASYPAAAVHEGRFRGILSHQGSVVFDASWSTLAPEEA